MKTVWATREGDFGRMTAAGLRVTPGAVFVALPSTKALWRIVRVWYSERPSENVRCALAPVLDVGPWNIHDEAYVFGPAQPAAGTGVDERGRPTNHAGIDLSDGVLHALGITDFRPGRFQVSWEFVEADPTPPSS